MHKGLRPRIHATLVALLLVNGSNLHAQISPMAELDAYIQNGMRDWQVPGLALAVVKDDSIIYSRGYGVREVAQSDSVDEHTLFAIGSNTKAFTAAAIGLLVQDGELSWDDEVIGHLPTLQLHDSYATQHLTFRDILSHRSGFTGGELLTLTDYKREDILRRIRHLKSDQTFRAGFAYNNILYLAAAEVISTITGESWRQFVEERIFHRLGMGRTVASVQDLGRFDNVASPHMEVDGALRPVPYRIADNVAPAGGIVSSAADMARWLIMLLREGEYGDATIMDAAVVRELRNPQVIIRADVVPGAFPSAHLGASGFGWGLQDYHDRLVVWHQGTAAGMASTVGFLPEEGLAVVVLTNTLLNDLHRAIFWRTIDTFLGLPERDWNTEFRTQWMDPGAWVARREEDLTRRRLESACPSVPQETLVGAYGNDTYGEVALQMEEDHLALRYGGTFEGDLDPLYTDAFRITWRDPALRGLPGSGLATFSIGPDGTVERLALDLGVFGRYDFYRK